MSRIHPPGNGSGKRAGAGGFTLTEMLVVIGIIVLVLGIATPMITRAWRAGDRARTAGDLAAIATALEAYKQDHGDYPRVKGLPYTGATGIAATDWLGARMLCRALIGPGPGVSTNNDYAMIADGAGTKTPPTAPTENQNGPGFRTRKAPGPDGRMDTPDDVLQGKVYGPYLAVDRFKLGDPNNPTLTTTKPGTWAILDRYNRPYLYFPASTAKPNIGVRGDPNNTPGYVHTDPGPNGNNSEFSMYDADDNLNAFARTPGDGQAIQRLRMMLGDKNFNGMIETANNETAASNEPYLLWSAGPDEIFGPDASMAAPNGTLDLKDVEKCDDLTNFRR
jgi:prepilin-type N-terminal cleavage/methylation domain-containing protein